MPGIREQRERQEQRADSGQKTVEKRATSRDQIPETKEQNISKRKRRISSFSPVRTTLMLPTGKRTISELHTE
jgi:hypothetical protein